LMKLMTREAIERVFQERGPGLHFLSKELIISILNGGRKCFAILVLIRRPDLITQIIKHHSNNQYLDLCSPLSSSEIDFMGLDRQFFEVQCMFLVPMFARGGSSDLRDKTILPFITQELIGGGGSSLVHRVEIYPECNQLGLVSQHVVACKTIRGFQGEQMDRLVEDLRRLSRLKHPNMIELLHFYTYKRRYHLIMPLRGGGSLEQLLNSDACPPGFESDEAFVVALRGLSSAIQIFHLYTYRESIMFGGHGNNMPKSILVDGIEFILAGFRGSNLTTEVGKTYRTSREDYISLERFTDTPETVNIIRRKRSQDNDIWSFGFLILDVVIYMMTNTHGGRRFGSSKRRWKSLAALRDDVCYGTPRNHLAS